jgi:hypothetical protein
MQLQALLKIFVTILKTNHLLICREMAVFYYKNRRRPQWAMQVKL